MAKRVLLVVLGVCVVAMVSCAELKDLRRQTGSLRDQLESCQRQRDELANDKKELLAEHDRLQSELAAAKRQAGQMGKLVGELQAEQMKFEQQRRELQGLVQNLAGIHVETRDEGNFIVLASDILFALGKIDLNEQAKVSLDKVAQYLLEHEELPIRIDGHTDGVPIKASPWEDNYHLAAMRAHAVMRHLADKDVSADRMHIVGFGPSRPRVEPDEPAQPVVENRRVEILLVPGGARSIGEILEGFQR